MIADGSSDAIRTFSFLKDALSFNHIFSIGIKSRRHVNYFDYTYLHTAFRTALLNENKQSTPIEDMCYGVSE